MKCIVILSLLPLFFGIFTACCQHTGTPSIDRKNQCECALYDTLQTNKTIATAVPLIRRSNIQMTCTEEDEEKCKILCTNLAKAAAMKGPQIVCKSVGDADNLFVFLYSQVCDNGWKFTDRASTNKLCCKDSLPVPCDGQTEVPKVLTNADITEP